MNVIKARDVDSVYEELKTLENDVGAQITAAGVPTKVFVTVQVETAWGRLGGGTTYVGIAQDLADFPFVEAIGLSSYPYLGGFAQPEDVPLNYYSRLAQESAKPVLVVEGGWSSVSFDTLISSPAEQARYIARQVQFVDSARAPGAVQPN